MNIKLEEIKKIRKQLNLTQKELANISNVSQSLIAKIESGLLDPTYTKYNKIIEALKLYNKNDIIAKDVMTKKIISINSNDKIINAIKIMKEKNISQLPVIDDNVCFGQITEKTIIESLFSQKGKIVADVMEDAPPILPVTTTIETLRQLLRTFQFVLIIDRGEYVGIITRTNLF